MMIVTGSETQYGIVIDAGSSGSRLHIYQWDSPQYTLHTEEKNQDHEDTNGVMLLKSVPQIHQQKNWTHKISPGLSSFKDKPSQAYSKHIKELLDFAKDIIPADKISETPIFIQATAGMRLLSKRKQELILDGLCNSIRSETKFLLEDCHSQIQIIDGETEGLYGWLSLNYLLGNFNNYVPENQLQHSSSGFMDMGGASTQLAFMPSDPEEISKHKEDIHTIYLKNINGDIQEWDVFVSTWLGFGANRARSRYLAQLINSLPENANEEDDDDYETRQINDPCLPRGAKTKFEFKDKDFEINGVGDFSHCLKSMYPLLLNNLPCAEEPCLFNGVHAPNINFEKDKFVGISEYWYTANDIFKMNGEYNFHEFSSKVKEFCESDWDTLKKNNEDGLYNNIPDSFLMDSCFKANWILNVLHEGFDLPRMDVDIKDTDSADDRHVPFKSADKINGKDLSWTLGRILMYASGLVTVGDKRTTVGIMPSPMEVKKLGKKFIPGAIEKLQNNVTGTGSPSIWFSLKTWMFNIRLLLFIFVPIYICINKFRLMKHVPLHRIREGFNVLHSHLYKLKNYSKLSRDGESLSKLEEGTMERGRFGRQEMENTSNFRSRSMMNLGGSMGEREAYPLSDRKSSHFQNSNPDLVSGVRPVFSMTDFSSFKNPNRS